MRAATITALYGGALAVAALFFASAEGHTMWRLLVADVAATVVIYLWAQAFKNSSFYDAYWSVVPPVLAAALFTGTPRGALVLALVTLWGARLTWNWYRGWPTLDHEDWRYISYRQRTGPFWPLVDLFGIMLMPTLLVFAGCCALWPAMTAEAPLGLLDGLAALFTLGAIALETVADEQLRAFRRSKPPKEAILDTGLWAWSRHPNYLGEIGFWCGLALFGLAADPARWVWCLGPLLMIGLFRFISIPLIEKRMLAKRPHYAKHQQRVSTLLLWPPR